MTTIGGDIDWKAVKSRLDLNGLALKKALQPGAAQIHGAQRKRAKRLAARGGRKTAHDNMDPTLSFWIGTERYAILMCELTEVFELTACTPVPGTPQELLGVVNLHGEIRPVLDSSILFNAQRETTQEPQEAKKTGYIVFMRRKGESEVGLMVDDIDEVRMINKEDLTIPGSEISGLPGRFIKGVTPDTMILIDTEELLSLDVLSEEK